jgi:predicted permease
MTESALLAGAAGVVAVATSYWAIPLLPALLPPGPDFVRFDIRLDGRVMLFTLLACSVSVIVFGLAPVLNGLRTDVNEILKSGGYAASRRYTGRNVLIAAQAGLGVLLIATAGLLTRRFLYTQSQRPGFDTNRNILYVPAGLPVRRSETTARCEQIAERLRALPGVKNVAHCRRTPLSGAGSGATRDVTIPGRAQEAPMRLRFNQVSPEYFTVTGTRILFGRAFTRTDGLSEDGRVALVNETMARQVWPGANPVGNWIKVGSAATQIIGVVEDAAIAGLHEPPEPFVYFPYAQMPASETTFLIETPGEPGALLEPVKREMRASAPGLVFFGTTSLRQLLRDAMYGERTPALVAIGVGAAGLLLTAAGLLGVVLHAVNRRMRELGVRVALGARQADLVRIVVRHGLGVAAGGAVAGALAYFGVARLLVRFVHGISPYDALSVGGGVAVVLLVGLAGSFYPAWKAASVDPADVLRQN